MGHLHLLHLQPHGGAHPVQAQGHSHVYTQSPALCRIPSPSTSLSLSPSPSLSGLTLRRSPLPIGIVTPIKVSASSASVANPEGFQVTAVPTKAVEGQKTGTSGLRKKVKVFMQPNYLANWIQALFDSLPAEDYKGGLLVLGGDGRYFNKEAAQVLFLNQRSTIYCPND